MKTRFVHIFLFLLLALGVQAQVTTAGMSGHITDNAGQDLIGATVIATHAPSGTQYGTITNENGVFNIAGMRSGGPYNVEVSFIGFTTKTISDILLRLGESYEVKVILQEDGVQLEGLKL
ncbi:MAG: carboxypeptidase regulatory-like domain-containing protein [Saprospiraceae bacterium]|nr:carboxypeptidase regulatory-like domain-containing protein [Saprospiraceae bacterium]